MLRFLLSLLPLFFLCCAGCTQKPDVQRSAYGTVVSALPHLDEAEKPFDFPYAGDNDHRNCEFPDDEMF